tara:strand:- start:473 stop:745 length:273 start_codon:yes stop_codon:yes gene_type:complete
MSINITMPSKKNIKLLPPRPPLTKWEGVEEGWFLNVYGCKVFCYDERYENIIWKYYDKKKFWLKHSHAGMIMIIECGNSGVLSKYELDNL